MKTDEKVTQEAAYELSGEQIQLWKYCNSLENPRQRQQLLTLEATFSDLHLPAAYEAIELLIKRHESLRTCVRVIDGEAKQCVIPYDGAIFTPCYFDVSTKKQPKRAAGAIVKTHRRLLETMEAPPLIRSCIFRLSEKEFYLCFLLHHFISDEWSMTIMSQELLLSYNSIKNKTEVDLPPVRMQARDYALWQRNRNAVNKDRDRAYWKNKLGELNLGITGRPHGWTGDKEGLVTVLNRGRMGSCVAYIRSRTYQRLSELSAASTSSISALVNTSLYLLLHSLDPGARILVNMPLAGRIPNGSRGAIAYMVGAIYLSPKIDTGITVKELTRATYFEIIEAGQHLIFDHDPMGLDGVSLRVNTNLYLNIMSQDIIGKKNLPANCRRRHLRPSGVEFYGLSCFVAEYQNGLRFIWKYNLSLYPAAAIDSLVDRYLLILGQMGRYPEKTVAEIIAGCRK